MNWWIDETPYPGPTIEPVGWAIVDGKSYPVKDVTITSLHTDTGIIALSSPRTLQNGDTLTFEGITWATGG